MCKEIHILFVVWYQLRTFTICKIVGLKNKSEKPDWFNAHIITRPFTVWGTGVWCHHPPVTSVGGGAQKLKDGRTLLSKKPLWIFKRRKQQTMRERKIKDWNIVSCCWPMWNYTQNHLCYNLTWPPFPSEKISAPQKPGRGPSVCLTRRYYAVGAL